MVAVGGEYLDGVIVVWVGRLWLQNAYELTEVVVDIITMRQTCYIELYDIELAVILWPYADMIAFVIDAEVLESLLLWLLLFILRDRVTIVVKEVEVGRLVCCLLLF